MPVAHLVITRLNLTLDFAGARDTLDSDWLRGRLEPFATFCHPSMRLQDAPHRWLVLCDERTPETVLAELAALEGVTPVLLPLPHDIAALGAAVAGVLAGEDHTHLLTTRLDSDDALAAGHLARVQAAFEPRDAPYFLNFPYGHIWHARRAHVSVNPASPFLSYAEPLGSSAPLTAYRVAHMWAGRVAPIRQLWAPSMWMQIVADHNEDTTVDGGMPTVLRRPPRGFRGQSAFAEPDLTKRFSDPLRAAVWYARTQRLRLGLFDRQRR